MILIVSYGVFLGLLTVYSYALLDPNITFFNNALWTTFRNAMVHFGYYQRDLSGIIYIIGITGLFIFHYLFIKKFKGNNSLKIALLVGGVLFFSYPFLS